jgi:voltage-gated sodium channel
MNWRTQLADFLEKPSVVYSLIGLIVLNAIVLGLETVPSMLAQYGHILHAIDKALLWIFVTELALKLIALGPRKCFQDPWNVFDFIVIAIALIPTSEAFAVLRALRILRALRLISMVPSMKKVVTALLAALPGMGSIVTLLLLVIYVSAVMATKLFSQVAPEFFGDLGKSIFTLFQIMTVEGWPDIARGVMKDMPYAWIFFVGYLICATFTVLNLFIAVIVNAMQSQFEEEQKEERAQAENEVLIEIRALRADVAALAKAR